VLRTHLKKVFLLHIGVEAAHQVLEILKYSCGLMLGFAFLSRRTSAGDLKQKSFF